ncbi:MAG TPA: molybdate ABC transporter substrate-binding protein, partial [Anaerolineae bacterium]
MKGVFFCLLLLLALPGCNGAVQEGASSEAETVTQVEGTEAAEEELLVFAAASLSDAFSEIAEAFEAQHPGVSVALNFAGSSQLAAQLSEGAEADVFASANAAQMQVVVDAGRITAGKPVNFLSNRITIVVPADNPADVESLEDLSQPGILLVLAVEGVPVRQYT